ncbi:MAG TPA: hypothetical protein VME47_23480 [Acetobacteraceae bacterium]|nr:hypothetical protein [Acetobacteraceae bacterium]
MAGTRGNGQAKAPSQGAQGRGAQGRGALAVTICTALGIFWSPMAMARAEFTLDVTQVGYDGGSEGPTYAGTCAGAACRATLPVKLGGDLCILNVWVGAPAGDGEGSVRFSAGPCRSGQRLAIVDFPVWAGYGIDRFGAATKTFNVPFHPAGGATYSGGIDDGVFHSSVSIRLDIIAPSAR